MLLPPALNLTSERLDRHGLHLIEDGQNMFLWLGRAAVPALVNDAFGKESYEQVQIGKVRYFPLMYRCYRPKSLMLFYLLPFPFSHPSLRHRHWPSLTCLAYL